MKTSRLLTIISTLITGVVVGNNLYAPQIIHPAWLLLAAVTMVASLGFEYNDY